MEASHGLRIQTLSMRLIKFGMNSVPNQPGLHWSPPVPTPTLAAAALTQAALQHAPALLRPFGGPHRGALQQMWHDVQNCAPGLWGPDLEPLPDPLSDHTLTQAQHTYARHRAQSTYDKLLRDADQPPQLRMQTLSRLGSVACRSASAWLKAVPTAFPLWLSDGDFRAALHPVPLPGGMRTKRPSTAGTEQAATGSCPSQWRPAAALVGPSWTCSPMCHPGLASTATSPSRASSLSRACSANFPSVCAAATLLSSGRWLVALCE
jgi:hypothetical protein